MKHVSIERKMKKAGFTVELVHGQYSARNKSQTYVAEWRADRNGDVCSINVRGVNDISDSMTDYHAGAWYRAISHAVERLEDSDKRHLPKLEEKQPELRTRARQDFQEAQEAKKERYGELAEKNSKSSSDKLDQARDMVKGIPFGQPHLVGHHSYKSSKALEKRHNNRIDSAMKDYDKSKYYAQKVHSVGKGGILSDDPEAIIKLTEKISIYEAKRERIKLFIKLSKKNSLEEVLTEMSDMLTPKDKQELASSFGYYFGSGHLSSVSTKIREAKKRLENLREMDKMEVLDFKINGVRFVEEDGRFNLYFDVIPNEELRKKIKGSGMAFKFSRRNECWTRKKTPNTGRFFIDRVKGVLSEASELTN